VSDIVVGLF